MLQIFNRGIVKGIIPKPMIFMFRPFVFLTKGVGPNLIPPALVVFVPPLQLDQDSRYQITPFPAPSIIVLTEEVKSVLAGDPANLLPIPHKKTALIDQGGSIRNIYMAANGVKLGPFAGDVVGRFHSFTHLGSAWQSVQCIPLQ